MRIKSQTKATLKIFFITFFAAFSILFSLLCVFKIYFACESVINGGAPGFIVQKARRGGSYYLTANGYTYSIKADKSLNLPRRAAEFVKRAPAAAPDALAFIYYAKKTAEDFRNRPPFNKGSPRP